MQLCWCQDRCALSRGPVSKLSNGILHRCLSNKVFLDYVCGMETLTSSTQALALW